MKDTTLMRLFIMPTIILLIAINIFPLLWSLFLSFSNFEAHKPTVWGKNPLMVGTTNYVRVLTDPEMWGRFITTAKYVVLSVGGEMLVGFGLALLLQVKFKGRGVITTLLVLPMTMSPVIVGLMWKLFMDPNWGMLNYLLGLDKVQWAQDSKINLYSIVLVDIWTWTPFVMLLSLAGLSAIPEYLYEAAEVDRASWWFKFTRITLPMVYPLLLVALIFRTMEAFKIFDLPMGLVGTGSAAPALVSMKLYILSFLTWKTGFGASLGYIVLVMIVAISSVFVKYLNKAKQ
jgi:multiple sugar transport system permease protein